MIFDAVAAAQVNVDTIIQNVVHGRAEMSFSVPAEDVPATRGAIETTQAELGAFDVEVNEQLGKVSLIGAGMRSHPGVAATMFRTLADLGINLRDDLDLADQDLLHDRARPDPGSGARAACRLRARARAGARADDLSGTWALPASRRAPRRGEQAPVQACRMCAHGRTVGARARHGGRLARRARARALAARARLRALRSDARRTPTRPSSPVAAPRSASSSA